MSVHSHTPVLCCDRFYTYPELTPSRASGGRPDVVRDAYASRGGVSSIAFSSSIDEGKISQIVLHLSGPATTPRTSVPDGVTERDIAKLKGLFSTEKGECHGEEKRRGLASGYSRTSGS